MERAGWVATDSKDNATATATKAAETGRHHMVYSVDASFSATAIQLLQIKDGTTVIWEGHVHDSREVQFPAGISISLGAAASAVLAASGTGGTNCAACRPTTSTRIRCNACRGPRHISSAHGSADNGFCRC